uniref:Beta-glucan synthesis-associated protein n=1 Tax=Peronospora matthiolae TaxID=2874970 RepID=A0AAV1V436_9STRA
MGLAAIIIWTLLCSTATVCTVLATSKDFTGTTYPTKSGIKIWVDPETPAEQHKYISSRGRTWDLVMSDEYNVANRSFRPGDDHIWTSLEKPDGVNGALELYSHNMTSTKCDSDGTCYFYIEVTDEVNVFKVFNLYRHPPGYENAYFYYRAAMVQSWNKFCFQGGMLEVRAQLPGAVSKESGNPDLALGESGQAKTAKFYPTWPGIWMMGNLGRAIFSASTNRMWPYSYDKCEPEVFPPENQRINACNDNPGYGLNPNQGRGAPEIDLLEGSGTVISSSLQIAPGMPTDFRLFPADAAGADAADPYCVYTYDCKTPGANMIDVPTSHYKKERGHKSWYQGLRYGANNYCRPDPKAKQDYDTVAASVKSGITKNTCSVETCPASVDVNGDLGFMDSTKTSHWGINSNGTCYPIINSYMGAYLCDPDNTNVLCTTPRNSSTPKSSSMSSFNYQMDAISSNWPIHLGGYLGYLKYQLEWVTGENGYVRWMLDGSALFEVTTQALSNVPQNSKKNNPQKAMLEEPMYLIYNVALSSSWGTTPPNAGKECRGNGTDPVANAICDSFPMFMKIDYIRLYQDRGDDLDKDNYMQVGCDPSTHPTKTWIDEHIEEYVDEDNPWREVSGKAFCTIDDDCTIGSSVGTASLKTGKCVEGRCQCSHSTSWGGPRCTTALSGSTSTSATNLSQRAYGPPMSLSMTIAAVVVFLSIVSVYMSMVSMEKEAAALTKSSVQTKVAGSIDEGNSLTHSMNQRPKDNYSQNFV